MNPEKLEGLFALSHELGMDCLVEVHDEAELEIALNSGARVIGINNRNLRTFETSLDTTLNMLNVPEDRILVTESGIHTAADVELMRKNSVNTFLVGEAFMRAENPGEKLHDLFG